MIVPTAWWHATCNGPLTVAIGGQDTCGIKHDCVPPHDAAATEAGDEPSMWRYCEEATMHQACHGDEGEQLAARMQARLLQPTWRLGHELAFALGDGS